MLLQKSMKCGLQVKMRELIAFNFGFYFLSELETSAPHIRTLW